MRSSGTSSGEDGELMYQGGKNLQEMESGVRASSEGMMPKPDGSVPSPEQEGARTQCLKVYDNPGEGAGVQKDEHRGLEQQLIVKKGELAQMLLMLRGEREQRRKLEESLQKKERELKKTAGDLAEVNTTLKVLMNRADMDRSELAERFVSGIRQGILPCLNMLKVIKPDERSREYLHMIESHLEAMISRAPASLSSLNRALTPTEIQVAYLVKEGKTTKEISSFMNLSDKAVEFHRNNIRKKLGLKEKKENLRKHLMSLEQTSS